MPVTKNRISVDKTKAVIAAVGGPSAVARLTGVKPPAVSQWLAIGMPDYRLAQLLLKVPTAVLEAM